MDVRNSICTVLALTLNFGMVEAQESASIILEVGNQSIPFELEASQSDWSGSESGGSVNISANPVDIDALEQAYWRLNIGFQFSGTNGDRATASVLRTTTNGERQSLFSEHDQGDMTVDLSEISVNGDLLSVSGTMAGQMGASSNYGRDIDLSEPLDFSGSFAVTLGPVNFGN